MQSIIQTFENKELGRVRVIQKDGQPWFVGKDVAEALRYGNTKDALAAHVDVEDKQILQRSENTTFEIPNRGLTIINESGLYSLILSSKLPAAKAFKRWVTSQILPAIRQHGAYITPETLERMREDNDFAEELLHRLAREHAKVGALMDYVDTLQPKARYYDTILQSGQAVPATLIAKDYGLTTVSFNKLLHALGVQYRIGTQWFLYKEYADRGYTLTKTYYYENKTLVSNHTEWTMKGRVFLYNFLAWYGILPLAEQFGEAV